MNNIKAEMFPGFAAKQGAFQGSIRIQPDPSARFRDNVCFFFAKIPHPDLNDTLNLWKIKRVAHNRGMGIHKALIGRPEIGMSIYVHYAE